MSIQKLFDKVLELEHGEIITLTFQNEKDLNSKRTMLFREKKLYEKRTRNKAFKAIFITKEVKTKEGIFKIHLSTSGTLLDFLTTAVVKDKEGNETPINLD